MKHFMALLLICCTVTVVRAQYLDIPQIKTFVGKVKQVEIDYFMTEPTGKYGVIVLDYDRKGRLISGHASNREGSRTYAFFYDSKGRLLRAEQIIEDLAFDRTYNKVVHYKWSSHNAYQQTTIVNGDTIAPQKIAYEKDTKGQIRTITADGHIWAQFDYDAQGVLVGEHFTDTDYGNLNTSLYVRERDRQGNPLTIICLDTRILNNTWTRTYKYTYFK